MKYQRPCICITLAEVVLWPKILGNRVCILTFVYKAMDYFFRRQKSASNLENNKCMCQRDLFVCHLTGFTHSGIFFWVYFKDIYSTLKGLGKNQFILEITLLNLYISKFHESLHKEKE